MAKYNGLSEEISYDISDAELVFVNRMYNEFINYPHKEFYNREGKSFITNSGVICTFYKYDPQFGILTSTSSDLFLFIGRNPMLKTWQILPNGHTDYINAMLLGYSEGNKQYFLDKLHNNKLFTVFPNGQ